MPTGKKRASAPEGRGGGKGPSTYARVVEITSGTTNFQQGLAATCKDQLYRRDLSQREDFGGADEPIGAMKKR